MKFSKKAAARLKALREAVVVDAVFAGDAQKQYQQSADEAGRIGLGATRFETKARKGPITIAVPAFAPDRQAMMAGAVNVNVNFYSARHRGPDNILSCDFIDGDLKLVLAAPIAITCSLISENRQTSVQPAAR